MDSSHWLSFTTMAGEHRESKKAQLALALARGLSISDWACTNQVPESTAFRWAKDRKVRRLVAALRRRFLDQAVGLLASNAAGAAGRILKLGEIAASESVQLRALRAILTDAVAVAEFATLEERLGFVEEELYERRPTGKRGQAR
ncbi:MAG: hypothetical protein ACLQVF_20665 [Isosphaeraceae bacterium]